MRKRKIDRPLVELWEVTWETEIGGRIRKTVVANDAIEAVGRASELFDAYTSSHYPIVSVQRAAKETDPDD